MCAKYHISQILGIAKPNHSMFDFIDININNDQKLFIDPCLIAQYQDDWYTEVNNTINSFFDVFYNAYRNNDKYMKQNLLQHAGEINFTKLGYGNGDNGNGNTAEGLIKDFSNLESLINDIQSISNVIDLPILISGFNEDGLSDMITNIIHDNLNDYTLRILNEFNINPNSTDIFYTWDLALSDWIEIERPCFKENGNKILLTPKRIVRKKYLFSANHFLQRTILEKEKQQSAFKNDKGKISYKLTKKELNKRIPKEDKKWKNKYVQEKSMLDETLLNEYHEFITPYYVDKGLSDQQLDQIIY